jgi:hypothetical protein
MKNLEACGWKTWPTLSNYSGSLLHKQIRAGKRLHPVRIREAQAGIRFMHILNKKIGVVIT